MQDTILAGPHPEGEARSALGGESIPAVMESRAAEGRGALTVHSAETERLTSADLHRASRAGARTLAGWEFQRHLVRSAYREGTLPAPPALPPRGP